MPKHLEIDYGYDPGGFYWSEAPSKRIEYYSAKKNRPALAEAIYQCNPGALEGEIFRSVDFRYYTPPVYLADGIDANLDFVKVSDLIIQSWDTAFSDTVEAKWTVCITMMLVPCKSLHGNADLLAEFTGIKTEDLHYDVYVLDIYRDKVTFGDLLTAANIQYKKWRPSYVLIEKKATGAPLLSLLETKSIPVIPVEPGGMSKRARAVHGVKAGSTQGWVQQHRVFFPKGAMFLDPFERELKNFSGDENETNDQVDAFVQGVNYAITQGAESATMPSDLDLSHYGQALQTPQAPLAPLLDMMQDQRPQICQFCINYNGTSHFCMLHQMSTTALDTCEQFNDGKEDPFY